MILGLLGIAIIDDILIGLAVAAVYAGISWGVDKIFMEPQREEAIRKSDEAMAKQERRGHVATTKQYSYALQQFSKGMLTEKLELLNYERERRAKRSHGTPVA